jgi:Ankyrin repeats (3 copies)
MIWFLIHKGSQFSGLTKVKSTIMMESAKVGQVGIIKIMLSHGVVVDFRDSDNHTALHRSCQGGYLEAARFLLENGADVNARCQGPSDTATPLTLAMNNGHLEVAEFLLVNNALVDTQIWNACAWKAAGEGHLGMVRFLCSKNKANLSIKTEIILGWWR